MLTQLEEDSVRAIVKDFMSKDLLFTALDISNEAKKVFPQMRHRDARDVVRAMFTSDMEPNGWARTDIPVTLADGSKQTALLYYPLSASWDLESLYDDQKRSQISNKTVAPVAVAAAVTQAVVDTVSDVIQSPAVVTAAVATAVASTALDVADAVATNVANTAHDLWQQMFQGKPSLFPRK